MIGKLIVASAVATLFLTPPFAQPQSPAAQLGSMTWLEGKWLGDFAGNPFWAQYSSPEGGAILSLSKDLTPGREPCYIEFELFSYDDTSVFLIPYPDGKPHSLKFRLVDFDQSALRAKFQNMKNDWPSDLTYERTSADSLIITLSGPGKDGKERRVISARLARVSER